MDIVVRSDGSLPAAEMIIALLSDEEVKDIISVRGRGDGNIVVSIQGDERQFAVTGPQIEQVGEIYAFIRQLADELWGSETVPV